MAKWVSYLCPNENCESHGVSKFTGEKLRASCLVLGVATEGRFLRCEKCGREFVTEIPPRVKRSYIGFNSSLGMKFNSLEHEKEYAKANGFVPYEK